MFSHVYLFIFRNDYKISSDTVFLSFILKNVILIIKHNGKLNIHLFNRIITSHLSSSVKPETRLSSNNIWRNTLALKNKKVQGLFGKRFILTLSFPSAFRLQNRVLNFFFLICFARELKGLYQISWGNSVGFTGIMYVFPYILAQD